MTLQTVLVLLRVTFQEWGEDKAPRLAAALSYYTIFSLAPLLVIAVAVAGYFVGSDQARAQVLSEIQGVVGPSGEEFVREMLNNVSRPGTGVIATVIGLATLILGASGVFGQLQEALNSIWEVEPQTEQGILELIKDRFLSFTMVLGTGFLLLVSFLLSAALSAISAHFSQLLPGSAFLWQLVNWVVSFGLIMLLFGLIFKVLPDAEIEWRDVWVGAGITAFLFVVGEFLIGLYLGRTGVGSAYGAAGSLVLILLWIYYSAQILFFGAEFTQVYARKFGSWIVPTDSAIASEPAEDHSVGEPEQPGPVGGVRHPEAGAEGPAPESAAASERRPIGGYVLIFLFALAMGIFGLLRERFKQSS